MKKFRLTNLTAASVNVEDIGIRLQRRGGTDSSVDVDEVLYRSSRVAQDLLSKRQIAVDVVHDNSSIPFWPLARPPVQKPVAPTVVPVETPEPIVVPVPDNSAHVEVLAAKIVDVDGKLSRVLEMLGALTSAPATTTIQSVISARDASIHSPLVEDEPMFIPSEILPKNAESSIKSKDGEVDKTDFDSAQAALKKARRKLYFPDSIFFLTREINETFPSSLHSSPNCISS